MKKMLLVGILCCCAHGFSANIEQELQICHFNIGGYDMAIDCETASQSKLLNSMMKSTSPCKDEKGHFFINQTQEYGKIVHHFLCNGRLPLNTSVEVGLDIAQIFGLDGIYPLFSYEPIA